MSTVTGQSPTDHTIKPKLRIIEAAGDNNKKKFQFLSAETTPDYRSKDAQDEKSKKTSTNESTKFQQQQQRKDIFKDINGKNPILSEQELRVAYQIQCEEMRKLRKQLTNSERRVKELEEQIKKITTLAA